MIKELAKIFCLTVFAVLIAATIAHATQKTRSGLTAEFDANIAFNSTGDITDDDINGALANLSDSAFNLLDDDSGDILRAGDPAVKTDSYTFTSADSGLYVEFNSSGALTGTIEFNSVQAYTSQDIEIAMAGKGTLTIAFSSTGINYSAVTEAGTLTFNSANGLVTLRRRASDTWRVLD